MQHQERREDDALIVQLMAQQRQFEEVLKNLTVMQEQVKRLYDAFPANDIEGHAYYHAELIKAAEARTAFWGRLMFELTKAGAIGLLTFLAYSALHELGNFIGRIK